MKKIFGTLKELRSIRSLIVLFVLLLVPVSILLLGKTPEEGLQHEIKVCNEDDKFEQTTFKLGGSFSGLLNSHIECEDSSAPTFPSKYTEFFLKDEKKYYIQTLGTVFTNKNDTVTRFDTDIVTIKDHEKFIHDLEGVFGKSDYTYTYVRSAKREYIADVWLKAGITLITNKVNKRNEIYGISMFLPNQYSLEDYKEVFVNNEDTRIKLSMGEV